MHLLMKLSIFVLLFFLFLFQKTKFGTDNSNLKIADIHNSTLTQYFLANNYDAFAEEKSNLNFQKLKKNNVEYLVLSIGIARFSMQEPDTIKIEQIIDFLRKFKQKTIKQFGDSINFGTYNSKAQLNISFALEGSHLLKGNISWIDSLKAVGIKTINIAHWFHNEFLIANNHDTNSYQNSAPSRLTPESVLSEKGKLLIEKMISAKVIIDVSHLPEKAFWQVVAINNNRTVLIASHSNSYTICPNDRNLKNQQIKAIKESGGIIGICLHSPLLSLNNKSEISDIEKHINYICTKFGKNILALGTDFDGRIRLPNEIEYIHDISKIGQTLEKSNFSDKEIKKILSQNAIRFYKKR